MKWIYLAKYNVLLPYDLVCIEFIEEESLGAMTSSFSYYLEFTYYDKKYKIKVDNKNQGLCYLRDIISKGFELFKLMVIDTNTMLPITLKFNEAECNQYFNYTISMKGN